MCTGIKKRNVLLNKITFLFLMIVAFCDLSASNQISHNKYINEPLPDSIKIILRDSLCDYIIPNENQFIDEWKSYDEIPTPIFAFSDFNGDSKKDYAIILLSKNYKKILLAVFLSDKNNCSFSIYKVKTFDLGSDLIDVFISVDKKGDWQYSNGKRIINYSGICVDWASESISFCYYWKNNDFQKFAYD